jgi:glycogen debranching enzyme
MADALGEDRTEIDQWTRALEQGAARLKGDAGVYGSIDLLTGTRTRHASSASFLCWYAGIEDPAMISALDDVTAQCTHPVPSFDPRAPEFEAMRYWRGPTWAILNALIGRGLADMGHGARAETLRQQTADLIGRFGFAEYFDPHSGAPAGGGSFTWTAAVWLAWASPSAGRRG